MLDRNFPELYDAQGLFQQCNQCTRALAAFRSCRVFTRHRGGSPCPAVGASLDDDQNIVRIVQLSEGIFIDDRRFDSLAKSLAAGKSRRSVLKGLLGLGGAAVVGGTLSGQETDAARRDLHLSRQRAV